MKDCIVCRGTGRYRFSDRKPGRIASRGDWIGPCPHCKGTGKVKLPEYRFHVLAERLDNTGA